MSDFIIHTPESAPTDSQELLQESLKKNGIVFNLHGILAESPEVLKAYQELGNLFMNSSLDAQEMTVVWQAINVEHNCTYCVPAHTAVANIMKVDPAITEALRNKAPMPTAKLQALLDMTLSVVRKRGNVSPEETAAFYAAGYRKRQLLEIILGISQKTISNYVNHIADTPLDAPFRKYVW